MSKSDIAIIALDGLNPQSAPIMMYNTVIADIIDGQIVVPNNVHIIAGELVINGNLISTKGNTRLGDVGDEFVAIVRDVPTTLIDAELSAGDNGALASVNIYTTQLAEYDSTDAQRKSIDELLSIYNSIYN